MASKQHRSPPGAEDGPAAKRARPDYTQESLGSRGPVRVELNPADCDLDFDIDGNGLQGHALHERGFAYCWSGARANVGITGGKYCFGCKIISGQAVDMADTPYDQQHLCRVGISIGDDPVGSLGETTHSFGFGGTGKFSNSGKFSDYGTKFGVGDTIVCAVNLEDRPLASIGFSKNGNWLGIAKQFDATSKGLDVFDTPLQTIPWKSSLFPHVMLKNVVVQLQFSIEDGLIPKEGYKPWNSAVLDGNSILGPSFLSPKECEVLMMVGLPASGKTTWAEKRVKEHPEKRYVLLGTNLVLDQMKVPGLLRKQNYGERFERLMDRATGIFNTLLTRAAKTPRNYILDQTNVYKSARNRKLKAFMDYRKVAVVMFPTTDELKRRADKRFKEMGKEVPAEAVNEMLANYVLPMSKDIPGSNEIFDEVLFPELSRGEAQKCLDEMNCALRSSNLNVRREISPYSRENSVQSFSPVLMNKGAPSAGGHWLTSPPTGLIMSHSNLDPNKDSTAYSHQGSVQSFSSHGVINKEAVGGHWPIPRQTGLLPNYDGLHSLQVVSSPSTGTSSSLEYHTRSDEATLSHPSNSSNSPYGNLPNYERPPLQRAEHDLYGGYANSRPYSRNALEKGHFPVGGMSTYDTHRSVDSSARLSFESPNSFERPSYGYPSPTAFPYSSNPGGHLPNHHVPGVDHSPARIPPYEWDRPYQTTSGSPYAAAPPPRPPPRTPPQMNPPPGSWYRH